VNEIKAINKIKKLRKRVKKRYGEEFSNLIKIMLEFDINKRPTIYEIL
jgi:hypothetical protein